MEALQPSDSNGPVTAEERGYAVESLQRTQVALHQAVEGLTPAQLTYKPSADRWSVTECLEHIALVEAAIFNAILLGMAAPADPDRRKAIQVTDVFVIKAVRSRAVTMAAPAMLVPTGRFGDAATALATFDTQREAAITYVETVADDLRTHYFKHFTLGTLDVFQSILLLAAHSDRHRKQIDEIKASSGFPH